MADGLRRRNQPSPDVGLDQGMDENKSRQKAKKIYERQLGLTNDLFMEVCAFRLQLEQREKALAEREKAMNGCRCGIMKTLRQLKHVTSSSSDGPSRSAVAPTVQDTQRAKKDKTPAVTSQAAASTTKKAPANYQVKETVVSMRGGVTTFQPGAKASSKGKRTATQV